MRNYHIFNRTWQKREMAFPETPTLEFRHYFQGPRLWSSDGLWLAYQEWRKMEQDGEFARFEEYILKNRDIVKKQVDEWPNPFVNGKKGEAYTCSFRVPECVPRYVFPGIEKLGLTVNYDKLDSRNCVISGVPKDAGEFNITMVYSWPGHRKGMPALTREFTININPDPRELWRDIPTSQDLEYYRPDTETANLSCAGLEVVAASRRGRSHAHVGLPRDDAFALDGINGWTILAVADGAGSAPYSRQGAAMACRIATGCCLEKLGADSALDRMLAGLAPGADPMDWLPEARKLAYGIVPNAFFEAHKAIRDEAIKKEREPKQYSTTLLMALCKKFPAGWIVVSFQIGDGAMAMFFDDGRVALLAEPDEGEYGGQTRFITMREIFESKELMRRLHLDLVQSLEGLALMTDGVSDAKFATLANLQNQDKWNSLWAEISPLLRTGDPGGALLDWLQFWSQGNHDDRTLAIMRQADLPPNSAAATRVLALAKDAPGSVND